MFLLNAHAKNRTVSLRANAVIRFVNGEAVVNCFSFLLIMKKNGLRRQRLLPCNGFTNLDCHSCFQQLRNDICESRNQQCHAELVSAYETLKQVQGDCFYTVSSRTSEASVAIHNAESIGKPKAWIATQYRNDTIPFCLFSVLTHTYNVMIFLFSYFYFLIYRRNLYEKNCF